MHSFCLPQICCYSGCAARQKRRRCSSPTSRTASAVQFVCSAISRTKCTCNHCALYWLAQAHWIGFAYLVLPGKDIQTKKRTRNLYLSLSLSSLSLSLSLPLSPSLHPSLHLTLSLSLPPSLPPSLSFSLTLRYLSHSSLSPLSLKHTTWLKRLISCRRAISWTSSTTGDIKKKEIWAVLVSGRLEGLFAHHSANNNGSAAWFRRLEADRAATWCWRSCWPVRPLCCPFPERRKYQRVYAAHFRSRPLCGDSDSPLFAVLALQ